MSCKCGTGVPHNDDPNDHGFAVVFDMLLQDREYKDKEPLWKCLNCGAYLNQDEDKVIVEKEIRFGKMRVHRTWKCRECREKNHKIHFENLIS